MINLDHRTHQPSPPHTFPVVNPPHQQHSIATLVHNQSHADRVAFYHAALGSPPEATLIEAMTRGFIELPGLTIDMVRKNQPKSLATALGHLDRTRQGQRSTQIDTEETTDDQFPKTPTITHTNRILTRILKNPTPASPTARQFTDLTGRFPVRSRAGNEYCLVMINEDTNYIHIEPMSSRGAQEYIRAYQRGVDFFTRHGFAPQFDRLDNETSNALEEYCRAANIVIQYAPPYSHRANKAERAIRTFKNHFISSISTSDPQFPLTSWDESLEQIELTLNLMRGSHTDPTISAWRHVHGHPYDYNAHPIAPIGTRVLIYESPEQRASWASHGVPGWYIGPAMLHYRCFRVLAERTRAIRTAETLSWHPAKLILPGASKLELITAAINNLSDALQSWQPDEGADHALDPTTMDKLIELRDIFNRPDPSTADSLDHLLQDPQIHAEQRVVHVAPQQQNLPTPDQPAREQRVAFPAEEHSNDPFPLPPGLPHPPIPPVHPILPSTTPIEPLAALQADPSPTTFTRTRVIHPPPRLTYTKTDHQTTSSAMDIATIITTPDTYRAALRTPQAAEWLQAHVEEINRLVEQNKCMKFIPAHEKPRDRIASYYNPQLKLKIKDGKLVYRVRSTIGGDKIHYAGETAAQTAALPTVKLLLNSAISDDYDWATADISDYYTTPGNVLESPEYMWVALKDLPAEIIDRYKLRAISVKGRALVCVTGAIYGLPQAGKISQDRLVKHLNEHGYSQCRNTPALFKHKTRPVTFSLVVDDFGIKYKGNDHLEHLFDTLRLIYRITTDLKGSRYIGLSIDYNKSARTVTISMPNYIQQCLTRFEAHDLPNAHSSLVYVAPDYGSKKQQIALVDRSKPLSPARTKRIQQITGTILYYARAVDPTMRTAVSIVSSNQSKPTENVDKQAQRLLAYAKTHPDAHIVYHASKMILMIQTDAAHLSETGSQSRAGGILYLVDSVTDTRINGSIECVSSIIPSTVASASEAEYGAMFMVAREAEPIRATLEDLGHPQPSTPIISDNLCAVGICNNRVKLKRSKAFDMRFHWIRDRVQQGHFTVRWEPGITNLADIFTKALPVHKFLALRNYYVQDPPDLKSRTSQRVLRGCVDHEVTDRDQDTPEDGLQRVP